MSERKQQAIQKVIRQNSVSGAQTRQENNTKIANQPPSAKATPLKAATSHPELAQVKPPEPPPKPVLKPPAPKEQLNPDLPEAPAISSTLEDNEYTFGLEKQL